MAKQGSSGVHTGAQQYEIAVLNKATNNFSEKNKIGSGGNGTVYKGKIKGQTVAIKKLNGNYVKGLSDLAKEVNVLHSLEHENLVKLLGFCSDKDHFLLVLEFVPKGDVGYHLKDVNKRQTLDWKRRLKIIKGCGQGLNYLHKGSGKQIIHCDFKPENILLDKDYNAKLADFGISRFLDASETHTTTTVVRGTLGYIAPELFEPKRYSTRSDVYIYGILILEIVMGKTIRRYAGETHGEILAHVVWKHWKEKKQLAEIIDPYIRGRCPQDQVERCIIIGLLCVQHHPKKRPSMEDVLRFLNSDDPLDSQPSFPGYLQQGIVKDGIKDELFDGKVGLFITFVQWFFGLKRSNAFVWLPMFLVGMYYLRDSFSSRLVGILVTSWILILIFVP